MSMRKHLRAIARAKMQKDGIERINKKLPVYDERGRVTGYKSFFSTHWRRYLDMPLDQLMKPKRKHGKRHRGFMERSALVK